MALITTLEGDETAAPLTINDLFNVNDYYGVKLFGNSWNQVKRAAAIIAQRAANAPIMFYLRAQKSEQPTGMFTKLGRDLWGYNDKAGVELLGRAAWGALKGQFDELLGWNPFSTLKKATDFVLTPITWTADKLTKTNIPVLKQVGQTVKFVTSAGVEFSPVTTGERLTNLAQNKGYVTQAEIDEAYEIEKAKQREQALKDSAERASKAASEAAKAQAEAEKQAKEYATKLQALQEVTTSTPVQTVTATDNTKTVLWVVGGLGVVYLLTRKRGK